jgi:NADH:ubiquinone reductase (non-electrogenic)
MIVDVQFSHLGVEITAELSDLAQHELKALYPSIAPLLRITMFDVAPHILGAYDKKLYEYATQRMTERGVRIATSSTIERVDSTHLHVKGEPPVPYGILLWVAGNQSIPLVDGLNAKKSVHGLVRVLTDEHLRVKKSGPNADVYTDVFALGDAADIEGQSLPTTAEVAVQKAKYLVQRLNQGPDMQGKPFAYSSRRLVTYIGGHDGIAQGSSVDQPWSGREAWLSWRTGSFTWNRTWRNKVSIVVAWVMNAVFGKDVMRL